MLLTVLAGREAEAVAWFRDALRLTRKHLTPTGSVRCLQGGGSGGLGLSDFRHGASTVGKRFGYDAEFLLHADEEICQRSTFGEFAVFTMAEAEAFSASQDQGVVAGIMCRTGRTAEERHGVIE